jgi:toxin ParE1/3/4
MKIQWTHEALERLMEVENFISLDSPERAEKFVDEIIEHIEKTLPGNPRLGRVVPEIAHPNIRELIFKKYRIVYRQNKNNIEILTIFEGHRLLRVDEIGR